MKEPIIEDTPSRLSPQAGLTLVEVVIAAGIIAVLMLASAAAMGESVDATNASRSLTKGAVFLESVEEDLSALSATDLQSMNGQFVYSDDRWADARFRAQVTVFAITVDLLQVRVDLFDQSLGRNVASVNSLRANS